MADNTLDVRIKQKYDTEANWSTKNPVLLKGEAAYSSDKDNMYKVGNGTSTWSQLSYSKADPTTHTHTKSQITDFPTSLKNPNALTIQGNGTTLTNGTYDGSAAKTVNITPSSIGAAPAAGSTSISTLASTITLGSGSEATILQNSASYQQKMEIFDNSTTGDAVFKFSQSTNSGSSFNNLMEIRDDGNIVANKFTGALSGNATTATKATQDSAGQQINTTYIKGLSSSGTTITYTKGDGSTGTITTQDTDTKNTTGSTDTSSKIFLVGATSQAANPQTYSDNQVYVTNGQLDSNKVRVAEKVTLQFDTATESLNFVFS